MKTGKLTGQRSQVSQDASDEINKKPHHSKELPWMFRACPFFPGWVAADCDNDQMVALLCNITNTLLPGDGSIDISQLPGHMSYSGANLTFMVMSFLNFSTPLIYFFGEAPKLSSTGEGSREARPFITEISNNNSTPVWWTVQRRIRQMNWRQGWIHGCQWITTGRREFFDWANMWL